MQRRKLRFENLKTLDAELLQAIQIINCTLTKSVM